MNRSSSPSVLGLASILLASVPVAAATDSVSIRAADGKSVLSEKDVACFAFVKDARGKISGAFRLSPSAAKRLQEFTRAHLGQVASLHACGAKVVDVPVLPVGDAARKVTLPVPSDDYACLKRVFAEHEPCRG